MIQNSIFSSNGNGYGVQNQPSIRGGGILFSDTNFTISSSIFYNNTAKYGAGIYISCQLDQVCVTAISNTTFTANEAQSSGGGIMYDLYRPALSNLVFSNNSALYGPEIGSYPIKIKIGNSSLNYASIENAVSGQITQAFTFSITDYDDQVMNLDSVSKIAVKPITSGAQTSGKSTGVAISGVAQMNEIILISPPGSKNVVFSLNSNTINLDIAKAVYGSDYALPLIYASFRYCRPGEYTYAHQWVPWSEDSFSLFWNSTQCEKCISNAKCQGDEVVSVDQGYWRKTTNSTMIAQWQNVDACNGGYNLTNIYPVNWASGYKGVLWSKWMNVGQDKYEKVSSFQCSKWASPIITYIRVFSMAIGFVLVILFIIYLKRKEGNQRTVLMRIMANYVQLMTTTLAYNMNLPSTISEIFVPLKIIGTGTSTVFSFDCFSSNSEFSLFTPSPTILKMFMLAITPILLWVVISIILGLIALITKSNLNEFKTNLIASNVVILFLILPTLIDTGLALFQCIEVDTGDFRVSADLDITWYSPEHIMWWFLLSLPILVVWVFGTQALILFYLIKNRNRLDSTSVKKYFHIIYIGYKNDRFYWEFVNTFKKFMIISLNVFLSQISKSYKAMVAVITIIVLIRLQMYLKPYVLNVNNEVENASMIAVGFTMYGGLLFMKGQSQVSIIEVFVFILIIVISTVYIMFWVYLMANTYNRHEVAKKLVSLLKIVLFRGDSDDILTWTNEARSSKHEDNKSKPGKLKAKLKGTKPKKSANNIGQDSSRISKRPTKLILNNP